MSHGEEELRSRGLWLQRPQSPREKRTHSNDLAEASKQFLFIETGLLCGEN